MTTWIRGKCIGKGAFGTINLALSKLDCRVFAVKSVDLKTGQLVRELDSNLPTHVISARGDFLMLRRHVRAFSGHRNLHMNETLHVVLAECSAALALKWRRSLRQEVEEHSHWSQRLQARRLWIGGGILRQEFGDAERESVVDGARSDSLGVPGARVRRVVIGIDTHLASDGARISYCCIHFCCHKLVESELELESSPRCVLNRVKSKFTEFDDDNEEIIEGETKIQIESEISTRRRIGKVAMSVVANWEA
ncbi:hypothetical protein RJT34_12593 [Clitoria ternatea]|uniref:Uncharacterized protein n=1 Tax=Clitoria ternatea TaxID=43366 RepID=A0AAN9JP27_CLITE